MVFLPNLIPSNQIKQSINFGSCIHVFDEEVLLPRDILEKRYKIYKTFGASLSYDYFGYQIWEENELSDWILTSLRERMGEYYRKKKCGKSFYKYQLMKTMNSFYEIVKTGAERFPISGQEVPHFSEM